MIRKYSSADKSHLLDLMALQIPKYFHPSEIADFEEYLEQEIEDYFVKEVHGNIVACGGINYLSKDKEAYISWDMVHPEHQGKGIGKKLLSYRIEYLRNRPGVERVVVRTSQMTHVFYQKGGFILKETQKDFWAPGFDLYKMVLILRD